MRYLEIKQEILKEQISDDPSSFISDVINSQNDLGIKKRPFSFEHDKLIEIGFNQNSSTKGYSFVKEFTLEELKEIALKVDKLDNHLLTHSYIILKIYDNKLYFWDTALIYEGIDTFEYCLEYYNVFDLDDVHVVTKSDSLNEELLNLAKYTKRYHEPALGFITQGCLWDKKEGIKILKTLVPNINEYMPVKEIIAYKQ